MLSRSDWSVSAQISSPAATTASTALSQIHGFRDFAGVSSAGGPSVASSPAGCSDEVSS